MSMLSDEALVKVEALKKIFNGSILVYTINNKKKREVKNKITAARSLWEQQAGDEDNELQLKRPKEESAVILAEVVMISDDVPEEFKGLLGEIVFINGLVGKTYWLSSNEVEELTWIDSSAIYGLVKNE